MNRHIIYVQRDNVRNRMYISALALFLLILATGLVLPVAASNHEDALFVSKVEDLHGLRVALIENSVVQKFLKRRHIQVEMVFVGTPLETLKAVSSGTADALLDNLATATYLIGKYGLTNLKVASPTES